MELKEFEDLTVGELRKINEKFKEHHPEIQTAEQLLEELNK